MIRPSMEDHSTSNGCSIEGVCTEPGYLSPTCSSLDLWYQTVVDGGQKASLICLPYAGTGSATFGGWRSHMFEGVDLIAAQLPGRDGRLREPPIDHMPTIVENLSSAILASDLAHRSISLLGCSVGAVMAFELAKELRRRGVAIAHLIVAACRPPSSLRATEPVSELPDEEMVARLVMWYNAIPADILRNEAMLKLLLPTIRADMRLYESYQYQREDPLACPITAIGGSDDRIVSVTDLMQWRSETTGRFHHRQFAGGHFFMKTDFSLVLQFIRRQLQRDVQVAPRTLG